MKRKLLIAGVIIIALLVSVGFLMFQGQIGIGTGKTVLGQYDAAPRTGNYTIDTTELLRLVKYSNSNTYNLLIRVPDDDIKSLEEFLGMAEKEGINVWVTILPPSELTPEQRTDIKYMDYIGWGRKLGKLSVEHKNLVAWSIDNVLIDYQFFTNNYLEKIIDASKQENPNLKFIPVVYYPNIESPVFDDRSSFFDGVQFYYTNFPRGESDESEVLLPQLEQLKAKFSKPIYLGIYVTPMSADLITSPAYIEQLVGLGREHTNGVMIYTMQRSGAKMELVKKLFSK